MLASDPSGFRVPAPADLIQVSPLSVESWEQLLGKVRGQGDPLSTRTLEVIVEGLREIGAVSGSATPPHLSTSALGIFARLAKAYNSPTLLKEAGLIYLRELGLPEVAQRHFERALRLGGPEKELRPLAETAAVEVQRKRARPSEAEAVVEAETVAEDAPTTGFSGIVTMQPMKKIVPDGISHTGRLLLPALAQTSSFRLVAGEPPRDDDADKLLPATTVECVEEARRAVAHHRFRRAEILLEKADVDPLDKQAMWQAWTDLGQACYVAGVVAQVQTAFLKALKYGPKDMASHFNVALGLHLNEKYEEALAAYLKANQIEPKHPKIWCNLGVLYFQMQQYALAESALRYATLASPDYARAWDNLAAALGAQDKLDEALEACRRAVELRPDYPEAHFKMGVIHFSRNEFDAARGELQRAALLPHLAAFSDCLQAMIHARLEQIDAAEAAVLRAVRTDSKCDLLWMAWNDLGLAHYAAGDFQAAATAYGEATMIKPDEAEAWFNLGVSYHRTGDLKEARDAYQQAVDLRESMSGAWHNLGIVCGQTNDHAAAMTAFRQEVGLAPGNVRAWYDLGVTLEKLGRREEARVAFSRVEALSPRKLARTARLHVPPSPAPGADETEAVRPPPEPDRPSMSGEPMTPQRLAELS
jgi:tetratricopeptide (TPR) repeat protein